MSQTVSWTPIYKGQQWKYQSGKNTASYYEPNCVLNSNIQRTGMKGRMENTEIRIRNRNRNRNRKRNRNWRNKWMLQVGKYDSHQNSSSLLSIPRKVDDDTPNSFKKRYVYIEHSSYHSFQLNWVTQNIFAFVGHSNTEELVEMWIRVKDFWLLNLCKTKTLTL